MNIVDCSGTSTIDSFFEKYTDQINNDTSRQNMDTSFSNSMKSKADDGRNESLDQSNREISVRFSTVEIRDYYVCIGDNPSVSRGVPISLDWDFDGEHSYEINVYECDRSRTRRHYDELIIPSLERIQILKSMGYSRQEINEQTKKTTRDKEHRFKTLRRIDREKRFKALVDFSVVGKAFRHFLHAHIPRSKQSQKAWGADCLREVEIGEEKSSIATSSSSSSVHSVTTGQHRDAYRLCVSDSE